MFLHRPNYFWTPLVIQLYYFLTYVGSQMVVDKFNIKLRDTLEV